MFCMLEKKEYILRMFRNITQIIKASYSSNDSKWRKMILSCSKKTYLQKITVIFVVQIAFIL